MAHALDLTRLTASQHSELLRSRAVSARELATAHLDRIAAVDGDIHAFLHVDSEGALAAADAIDAARAAGEELGPLAGVPLALKDVLTMKGAPTTCGSRILEGWHPPYDATVTRRLREAGIVILGKTNMDEFAMGSSTEHSAYGPTHNPWDLDRIPGGSGGGSAAALAAFEAPLAIGTDTGGSIRQPAAVTGTVGVKPTYGAVSRYGLVALASSLDQAGPCARTVLDTALLHEVIAGYDPMDSTSLAQPVPDVVAAAKRADVTGMRIGLVKELGGEGYQAGVRQRFAEAVTILEKLGAEVVEVSCPSFDYALAAYYLILPSEASSNLAKFDGMRYGQRVGDDGSRSVEEVMSLDPRGRLRGGGEAPDHAGHLRPLERVLRRVLRLGAEGAHAHPARLRSGVRAGRRADLADRAHHGVQARREARRPAGDVPQRRRDDPGEPRRERSDEPAGRSCPGGRPACGSADHRPGDGR